jgi:hypothetical protein
VKLILKRIGYCIVGAGVGLLLFYALAIMVATGKAHHP